MNQGDIHSVGQDIIISKSRHGVCIRYQKLHEHKVLKTFTGGKENAMTFHMLYLDTVVTNVLLFSILIRSVTMGSDKVFRPL